MTLTCLCKTPDSIVWLLANHHKFSPWRCPCSLPGGVGLDNLWNSLPNQTILPFYDPGFLTHLERLLHLQPWWPWASGCQRPCWTRGSLEISATLTHPTDVLPTQLMGLTYKGSPKRSNLSCASTGDQHLPPSSEGRSKWAAARQQVPAALKTHLYLLPNFLSSPQPFQAPYFKKKKIFRLPPPGLSHLLWPWPTSSRTYPCPRTQQN